MFTEHLIFSAGIDVPQAQPNLRLGYPQSADVAVIPRSAVKSVTLHDLHNFGQDGGDGPDIVGFTVTLDGHPPVVVNLPRWSHGSDGAHSRVFDSLVDGLARQGK